MVTVTPKQLERKRMKTKKINNLIDFHAHIIPGADHGSRSLECSRKQLELLSEAGIEKVVATPHFYAHKTTLDQFLDLREKCIENMKQILTETSPTVYSAAEVLLVRGLDNMDGLEKLCINGTNRILIEFPLTEFDDELENTLLNIKERGLYPIAVHIERYEKSVAKRMCELNIPCQVNVSSLASFWKRREIMKYVSNGTVQAIGTDIHGADEKFANNYKKVCNLLKDDLFSIMDLSEKLLENALPVNVK